MLEGIIGFALGMVFTIVVIRQLIFKFLAMIEQDSETQVNTNEIKIKIELVNNQLLCYNSSTMAFVCQGADLKEILDKFNSTYPNKDIKLISDNADLIADLAQQKEKLADLS